MDHCLALVNLVKSLLEFATRSISRAIVFHVVSYSVIKVNYGSFLELTDHVTDTHDLPDRKNVSWRQSAWRESELHFQQWSPRLTIGFFLSNISDKRVGYVCEIIIVVRKIKIFEESLVLHHKYFIKPTPLKQSFGILIRIDINLLRELIYSFQSAFSYITAVAVIIMYWTWS